MLPLPERGTALLAKHMRKRGTLVLYGDIISKPLETRGRYSLLDSKPLRFGKVCHIDDKMRERVMCDSAGTEPRVRVEQLWVNEPYLIQLIFVLEYLVALAALTH